MNLAQVSTRITLGALLAGMTLLTACGGGYGSGSSSGGSMGCGYNGCPMPQTTTVPVALSALEVFPANASTATGSGSLTVDQSSGALSGSITLNGASATAVELGDAFAGASGPTLATLEQHPGNANQWDVGAGAMLSPQQQADLAAGKLYVQVRTAAHPDGELRGQLLPSGIVVRFATLSGSAEVPPVTSAASGLIAVTVNAAASTAAAHVTLGGVVATGAMLATGAADTVGGQLATLNVDANDPNHYFNDAIMLTAADVTNFSNGLWYGNVSSAAHPGGELRGQLAKP